MGNFQLSGLAYEPFQHYFAQSDEVLRSQGVRRVTATASHGFPCRVSLTDATSGEELLLLPFEHHQVTSPYRASGPIYVRKGATQAVLPAGVVPPYIALRLISLRAYDDGHIMVRADVADGTEIAHLLQVMFQEADVSYVHLHNAKPGCFACSVSRATGLS
jgi:hypothetical protein